MLANSEWPFITPCFALLSRILFAHFYPLKDKRIYICRKRKNPLKCIFSVKIYPFWGTIGYHSRTGCMWPFMSWNSHGMSSQIIFCWLKLTLLLGKHHASVNIDRMDKVFHHMVWGTDGRDGPPKVQVLYGALMHGWTQCCPKHWRLDLKTAKMVQDWDQHLLSTECGRFSVKFLPSRPQRGPSLVDKPPPGHPRVAWKF